MNYKNYIFGLSVLVLLGFVLLFLKTITTPLIISAMTAYILHPVVKRFQALKLNYFTAVLSTICLAFLIIGTICFFIFPILVQSLYSFVSQLPDFVQHSQENIITFVNQYFSVASHPTSFISQKLLGSVEVISKELLNGLFKSSLSNALTLVFWVFNFFLFPIFLFYILYYSEKAIALIYKLFPNHKDSVSFILKKTHFILKKYIRGQLLICCILAVLYSFALYITGLPYALLIGSLTGFLNVVPYFGFSFGLLSTLLLVIYNHFSLWQSILIFIALFSVQTLESFVISPKILGNKMGLNPFITLIALIVGGNAFGFLGILFAVPATALIKEFLVIAYRKYITES